MRLAPGLEPCRGSFLKSQRVGNGDNGDNNGDNVGIALRRVVWAHQGAVMVAEVGASHRVEAEDLSLNRSANLTLAVLWPIVWGPML